MKVTVDALAAEVNRQLEDYSVVVTDEMKKVVKKVAKEGAKEISSNASVFKGTGKYAKGWKAKLEDGRVTATGIIYNTTPGLPHLLEHGHAKRGGGRVSGTVHIAPVADSLEEKLISELEESL